MQRSLSTAQIMNASDAKLIFLLVFYPTMWKRAILVRLAKKYINAMTMIKLRGPFRPSHMI